MVYRSTPHSTTGVSPPSLMFRHYFKPQIAIGSGGLNESLKLKDQKENYEQKKIIYKMYADSKRQAELIKLNIRD